MVNDRGNMKWTSLMLPEHVEMLREWYAEDDQVDKPVLSDDKLAEMDRIVQQAIQCRELVAISCYDDTEKRILQFKGIIIGGDGNMLEVQDEEGKDYILKKDILDVRLSEL